MRGGGHESGGRGEEADADDGDGERHDGHGEEYKTDQTARGETLVGTGKEATEDADVGGGHEKTKN